jgi:pimeloyl-ACP methyl ester carboxylesterase
MLITSPFVRQLKTVQHQNISYYDNQKTGKETLLLLHGLAGDSSFWRYNIPFWDNQNFRVIAVDMHGINHQTAPKKPSIEYLARTLHAFMQSLNVAQYHIVGHSMGGQIAVCMSYWYPDKVKSMHLLAPAGFEYFSKQDIDYLEPKLTPEFAFTAFTNRMMSITYHFHQWKAEWEWFHQLHQQYFNEIESYPKQIASLMKNMLHEPIYDILPYINVPTQVFAGEKDNLIPNFFIHQHSVKQVMTTGTKKMKNATLTLFEKTGHNLMIENSDTINRKIAYFIKYEL